MPASLAELSSITSALEELSGRISKLADNYEHEGRSDLSYELFEVERSLTVGLRRLTRLTSK